MKEIEERLKEIFNRQDIPKRDKYYIEQGFVITQEIYSKKIDKLIKMINENRQCPACDELDIVIEKLEELK